MLKEELENELENSRVRTYLIDFIDIRKNDTVFVDMPCASIVMDFLKDKSNKVFGIEGVSNLPSEKADFIFSIDDPRYERVLDEKYFSMMYNMLAQHGKFVFSVMNSLSFSYIEGENEIHSGEYFGGLSGNAESEKTASFTKRELAKVIKDAGFSDINFYYPVPDAIFPTEIYSDDYQPGIGDIPNMIRNYGNDGYSMIENDNFVNKIISEGLFPEFANSFLVIAGKNTL